METTVNTVWNLLSGIWSKIYWSSAVFFFILMISAFYHWDYRHSKSNTCVDWAFDEIFLYQLLLRCLEMWKKIQCCAKASALRSEHRLPYLARVKPKSHKITSCFVLILRLCTAFSPEFKWNCSVRFVCEYNPLNAAFTQTHILSNL